MTIDLDAFIVELPSYMAALQVFRAYGAEMVGVPQDDEGMETDRLAAALAGLARQGRHPKFIYVVPDFQNPSGITWTEERRHGGRDLEARRHEPVDILFSRGEGQ